MFINMSINRSHVEYFYSSPYILWHKAISHISYLTLRHLDTYRARGKLRFSMRGVGSGSLACMMFVMFLV